MLSSASVSSSSTVQSSSSWPASIYHVRGTHNNWVEGKLMTQVGANTYQSCINFNMAAGTPNRFKIDPNGGWIDAIPAQDFVVSPGWVQISFDKASGEISVQENLAADCVAASSSSSTSRSVVSSSRASSSNPTDGNADVKNSAGALNTHLACAKGNGEKACNLRTYQVMVEAFVNGDNTINMNIGYGTSNHKGDLQGIINSLDYIQSLGMNSIWLTPVFDSTTGGSPTAMDASGYFLSNYFKVDPYFGSEQKLRELIDAAHAKGLYVFLDGVFGHYKSNASNYPSPSGKRVTAGGVARYPQDLEFFKEVATHWITNYKIDGWRLDQAYQVPVQNWLDIRNAVKAASANVTYTNANGDEVNPLGYMVGEIWDGEGAIKDKGYGSSGTPGLLSMFDFPMRYRLVQTLAVEESGVGRMPVSNLNDGFKSHDTYPDFAMPNLMIDNHDLVRFGDLLQRGKIAGPNDDQYWLRHKAVLSFMAAYTGPITLYYGDEIGQEVPNFADKVDNNVCSGFGFCDDHASRSQGIVQGVTGSLNDRQSNLKDYTASLMKLRDAHPSLWNGSRTHIYSSNGVYMDLKVKGSERILYALNATNNETRISVAASVIGGTGDLVDLLNGYTYTKSNGVYYLVLGPFEGAFLNIK